MQPRAARATSKRWAAALLGVLLTFFCALPAHATEGFAFNWDSGREGDSDHPHCKSLFMLNLDTDTVVYTYNPDEQLPMASMTKIMTYIIAYENIPDIENTVITVPQSVADDLEGTGSSLAGVQVGEELTGLQLLYLLMVPSGNDAALTLMEHVDALYASGSIVPKNAPNPEDPAAPSDAGATPPPAQQEEYGATIDYSESSYFVRLMNEKAQELGCRNTHFSNPHGLHKENHYSTARDMAIITQYAMTLPNFSAITSAPAYNKPQTNLSEPTTLPNTNKMLLNFEDPQSGINYFYTYASGVKTGSHDQAGHCLTASATTLGYTYIVVAMGDMEGYQQGVHNEMLDARTLFRWAFTSLEKKTITTQGDILSSVKLEYAYQKDELLLAAETNVSVMLPNSVDQSSIITTVNKPESVQAPIRKGEVIGTATMRYADEVIATVPVVAAESVPRSDLIAGWEQGRSLLTSPWFIAAMAVIGALIAVYLILVVFYRRKQRQLRRVKKFRDL
ncbi:D-alanyl-D-alanine carboxypeptidase family protein [Acutalibacter caecimuris]|uniref:D-alanyl-D-alanine carboxypeptidase family protein n=1 Tax=Acutalibacter caecimuris TaxID=3093657 RepID=UPI002AC8A71A|nr:serine hydrolase [Acutalibacter sp. M00118]